MQTIVAFVMICVMTMAVAVCVRIEKKIQHSLNANAIPAVWTTVAKNEYNALGQLMKKELGKQKHRRHLQRQSVECSTRPIIRGWLTGINKGRLVARQAVCQPHGRKWQLLWHGAGL